MNAVLFARMTILSLFTVPPPGNERRDARGNSRAIGQSFFCAGFLTLSGAEVTPT